MREGRAPLAVRRRAAEGQLPLPVSERIELLVWLAADADEQIRAQALGTLENWNVRELEQVLSDPATPAAVLDFALESPVLAREELLEAVLRNPAIAVQPAEVLSASLQKTSNRQPLRVAKKVRRRRTTRLCSNESRE
ncbi:MAG TPA: hypothetical protein VI455_15100 [Terriglobia bacterium]